MIENKIKSHLEGDSWNKNKYWKTKLDFFGIHTNLPVLVTVWATVWIIREQTNFLLAEEPNSL